MDTNSSSDLCNTYSRAEPLGFLRNTILLVFNSDHSECTVKFAIWGKRQTEDNKNPRDHASSNHDDRSGLLLVATIIGEYRQDQKVPENLTQNRRMNLFGELLYDM
jgi:hypothetical protein